MIGTTKPDPSDKNRFIQKTQDDKAVYEVDPSLSSVILPPKNKYLNMLSLLADSFNSNEYDIVAIATDEAKKIQEQVLEFECIDKKSVIFKSVGDMKDTANEYSHFFAKIVDILSDYEEVIIDLSHGFRHLPLLTLIALIVHNFKDKHAIKHILFAQEIKKDKNYKIIDLAEYLDIATVSYSLAAFNKNYTVANTDLLRTDKFRPLIEALEDFSKHILANSIQMIFEKRLVHTILEQIEVIERDENIVSIAPLLANVKLHLNTIDKLSSLSEYRRLFELSTRLLERGYLLNAITILNEALPLYVLERMNDIGLMEMDDVEPYQRASAVGNFISDGNIDPTKMGKIDKYFYCSNYDEVFKPLRELREQLRKLRNDLAHANGSEVLGDINTQMNDILQEFKRLAINEDIGKKLNKVVNKECMACKMNDKVFEENATTIYQKYFKFPAPQKPFESRDGVKKFELILKGEAPIEWKISKPINPTAKKLLEIMRKYENAKRLGQTGAQEKEAAKEEFYRYFR